MERTLRTLRSRNDDGLAMVEFAIVGSLLMVLLFGIASVGLLINAHIEAADEARFNARLEAVKTDCLTNYPSGIVIMSSSPRPVPWFLPFGSPDPVIETVRYKCGG